MNNLTKQFRDMHANPEPLIIGNAWNAQSAKVMQAAGFKAVATSSSAVAESIGYEDGENMPFDDYLFVVRRIRASVDIPCSVDLEGGYADSIPGIVDNIEQLYDEGVSGLNIEDSSIHDGKRSINDATEFAKKIETIVGKLRARDIDMFINLRCDPFILRLPDPGKEAIKRIYLYSSTGVDGIFLPCITDPRDIKAAVGATQLPINVMSMPGVPQFNVLRDLGVKRISLGPFAFSATYKKLEVLATGIVKDKNLEAMF
jgi:2-methylisocitrate lyase-like PEP mutase family enzyme